MQELPGWQAELRVRASAKKEAGTALPVVWGGWANEPVVVLHEELWDALGETGPDQRFTLSVKSDKGRIIEGRLLFGDIIALINREIPVSMLSQFAVAA